MDEVSEDRVREILGMRGGWAKPDSLPEELLSLCEELLEGTIREIASHECRSPAAVLREIAGDVDRSTGPRRDVTVTVRVRLPRDAALRAINALHGRPGGVPLDEEPTPEHVEATHSVLASEDVDLVCSIARDGSRRYRLPGEERPTPLDMLLPCPRCGLLHVDAPEPDKGWSNPPHKSHLCHDCGCIWRPASVPTNGVASIAPGKADTWISGKAEERPTRVELLAERAEALAHLADDGSAIGLVEAIKRRELSLRNALDDATTRTAELFTKAAEEIAEKTPVEHRGDEIEAEAARRGRALSFEDMTRFAWEAYDNAGRAASIRTRQDEMLDAAAWLLVAQRQLAREAAR